MAAVDMPMSERLQAVREAVTLILRSYMHAETPDEREEIAREIARLDHGAAQQTIGELALKALDE